MTTAQFPDEHVDGGFARQEDAFTQWVTADGSSGFPAAAGRYHLYVSLACPWAHRTIIVRRLKRLDEAIGMTVVDPLRDDDSESVGIPARPLSVPRRRLDRRFRSHQAPLLHDA